MSDESFWVERAQSAETKLATLQANVDRVKDDAKQILDLFGARKAPDGTFSINFDKLAKNLGLEQAMELRGIIDTTYNVVGEPGDKPRIKLSA